MGKNGTAAFKKWANSEWVNLDISKDTPRLRAYKSFFQKWYEAGLLNIKPWNVVVDEVDAEFPSFLEDKFYEAGIKDRAA